MAQYLSQRDSSHVASLVVCAGVAEGAFSSLAFSYSHCPVSTSCLVDLPILPAWPISVLLKYMTDRIQTILLHHQAMKDRETESWLGHLNSLSFYNGAEH